MSSCCRPVRRHTCRLPQIPEITTAPSRRAGGPRRTPTASTTTRIHSTATCGHRHKLTPAAAALNSFSITAERLNVRVWSPLMTRGWGLIFFLGNHPFPSPCSLLFTETRLDIQVFYSICGSDHPSSRSITLPAAFINDLVSRPALGCSRLSRMIDH